MKYIKLFEQFVNEAADTMYQIDLCVAYNKDDEEFEKVVLYVLPESAAIPIVKKFKLEEDDFVDISKAEAKAIRSALSKYKVGIYPASDMNSGGSKYANEVIKHNIAKGFTCGSYDEGYVNEAAEQLNESQEDDINMAKDYIDTKSTGKHCLYFNFMTPQAAEKFAKFAGVKADGDKVLLRCSNSTSELNSIKKEYMNAIDASSKKAFNHYGIGLSVE
jgi:hypothetical protein